MEGEFWIKDHVPFEFIKAVGVPYQYLINKNGKDYADDILMRIEKLMKNYHVNLSIVDTSSCNKVLFLNTNVSITSSLSLFLLQFF
jgi:hypothetical protein